MGSRAEDFYTWTGPGQLTHYGGRRLRGPGVYHRVDQFASVHRADPEAVRAALPTDDLFPARWVDGSALVIVFAMRYHEVSLTDVTDGEPGTVTMLTPYGEVGVAALVTRRPAPRALPLFGIVSRGMEAYVLHLPVTTREACVLGREIYGLPKFVADMDFTESPVSRSVTVFEGGDEVLALTVRPGGPVLSDRTPSTMYSVLGGRLLETVTRRSGHSQIRVGGASGCLALGSHPVGRGLRDLGVWEEPLLVVNVLDLRLILPSGTPVGKARDYHGYTGSDCERGRFTVAFPGTGRLDQYTITIGQLPTGATSG